MFAQVGVWASSKSAMKTLAPELSALITILRSVGPVISTQRFWKSGRAGGTRPVAVADRPGLGQEIGEAAGVQLGLALGPAAEQRLPGGAEVALEAGDERERRGGQDLGDAAFDRGTNLDASRDGTWL